MLCATIVIPGESFSCDWRLSFVEPAANRGRGAPLLSSRASPIARPGTQGMRTVAGSGPWVPALRSRSGRGDKE
jgi:hypothetical protein